MSAVKEREDEHRSHTAVVLSIEQEVKDDLVALAKALGVSVSRLLRPYLKLGLSVHRELDQKANSTKVPLEVLLHRYFRVGQKLDEIGGRSTDGVIDLLVKPYHYGNGDGGEQELVRLIMG